MLFIMGRNCQGSRVIKTSLFSHTCTQHTSWRNYEWTLWWKALFKWYPKMTEIQWPGDVTRWEKLGIFYVSLLVRLFFTNQKKQISKITVSDFGLWGAITKNCMNKMIKQACSHFFYVEALKIQLQTSVTYYKPPYVDGKKYHCKL